MSRQSTISQRYGLPSLENLQEYEIWDSYFTPADSGANTDRLFREIQRATPACEMVAIRRQCAFLHIGLGTASAETERRIRTDPDSILAPLRKWPDRLLGMLQLNANDLAGSLAAVDRWLKDGPLVGVYLPGGGPAALACSHRNLIPLVERIAAEQGVIMQHTWYKTGRKQSPGESTPAELAQLAARFPQVPFICAHAGGEWEQGIRAVRSSPNILVETSGFDPTAGFLEMAVRELGAARIVFGSHLPSRSLGTELGKIFGAEISDEDRHLILGSNLRRLLKPIQERKRTS